MFSVPGNSSYRSHRYQHGMGTIHSKYGVFLDQHCQTIFQYARKVLARMPPEDPDVRRSAGQCLSCVPEFRDGGDIVDREILARQRPTLRPSFLPLRLKLRTKATCVFTNPDLNSLGRELLDCLFATDRDLPFSRYVSLDAMASNI